MLDGLLLVNKPRGCTSHDVVVQARRILRQKKIGHCGTLDPDATGLLVLTLGRATRLTRFLIRAPKIYEGSIRLGVTTDTYDLAGTVTAEHDPAAFGLDGESVAAAMERFVGTYMQTPPPYCARKIGGVKYYELARRGEEVPDTKKEVTVYAFRPLAPWTAGQDLAFGLSCASGTYARSLAHELGAALGCGGCLSSLQRTQVGSLTLDEAIDLEDLRTTREAEEPLDKGWIPFDDIPLPFDAITADPQQERRIQHGQSILVRDLDSQEGDWVKLMSRSQRLLAVGAVSERIGSGNVGVVQPKVVFQ